MQLQLLRYTTSSHLCEEGVALEEMARAFKALDKQYPGLTLDQLPGKDIVGFVAWSPRVGNGKVSIERLGLPTEEIPVLVRNRRQAKLIALPPNAIVRLRPHEGLGVALVCSPNGSYAQALGADAMPMFDDLGAKSPMQKAALQWLRTGEVGRSSRALCHATLFPERPLPEADRQALPRDLADVRRIVQFIQAVPGLDAHFKNVQRRIDEAAQEGPEALARLTSQAGAVILGPGWTHLLQHLGVLLAAGTARDPSPEVRAQLQQLLERAEHLARSQAQAEQEARRPAGPR